MAQRFSFLGFPLQPQKGGPLKPSPEPHNILFGMPILVAIKQLRCFFFLRGPSFEVDGPQQKTNAPPRNHVHFEVCCDVPLARTKSPEVAKLLLAHPEINVNPGEGIPPNLPFKCLRIWCIFSFWF